MFKQSCTNLTTIPKQRVRQWLSAFETVVFDADGVLWHFDKAIDGAVEAFNQMGASGRRNFIVTNNSSMSCDSLVKKANNLGLEIDKSHMLSSSLSIANYLTTKNFQRKVYVVGDVGITEELAKLKICSFTVEPEQQQKPMHQISVEMVMDPDVGAVVVGKDDTFNVSTIIRACNYLQNRKILFLGTCMDSIYPIANNRVIIGAGAMIAAIKTVSGRKPLIMGKPNPWLLREPINCGLINPETTLMVGDTLSTDILFAHYNGFQSLFVGTGVNRLKDVEKLRNSGNEKMMQMVPDAYLPKLGLIHEFLS
ncbi:glycerol-3-phosphate phosphatase [Drosophila montana]|uniref:glycerol-3-phosphate phosphatase n=1 Tax=Drosophila montana TaxID=40370 RepID=UPI00313E6994